MKVQSMLSSPTSAGICWGIFGGIKLIVISNLTTNGYLSVLPLFFIVTGAVLTTKNIAESGVTFKRLFISGFYAFMISSLMLYAYQIVINPTSSIGIFGNVWRLAFMAAVAAVSSLIMAFIAKPVR